MDLIRQNPQQHFEDNYLDLRDSDMYDVVGVLSLTSDPLNETMWAYYSNNYAGFCIGYDTVAMSEYMGRGFGFVEYDDTPPLHSFIHNTYKNELARDEK